MKSILPLIAIISAQLTIAQSDLKVHFFETDSGKFGLADENNQILIRPIYDETWGWRCEENAKTVMLKKNETWFLMTVSGSLIIEFSEWNPGADEFRYGLLPVEDKKTGKWGYINEKSEIEIPLIYDNTNSFEIDLPLAAVKQGKYFGLLTTDGKWYLKPKYDYFYEINSEDSFIVQIKSKFYHIDGEGKVLEEVELGC